MSFRTGDTVEADVLDVAQGGWCVARPDDGPVIFIRHALPGERVRARVTEVTSRFARAEAVEILHSSPERITPACPSARPFGCGGCDWQHASLPAQRDLKAAVIGQQLRRLAGIDLEVTVEPLPGDEAPDNSKKRQPDSGERNSTPGSREAVSAPGSRESASATGSGEGARTQPGLGWRTRVQFAVRPDGRAGLRAHRSHEVVDIGDCLIAHPAIRDLDVTGLPWPGTESVEVIVGLGGDDGDERAVIVTPRPAPRAPRAPRDRDSRRSSGDSRRSSRGPERLSASPDEAGRGRDTDIRSEDKEPDGVTAVAAEAVLSRAGRRLTPLRGRPYLRQHAAGRDWRVSATAFWQVHPAAAGTLCAAVIDVLEPKPGDSVLDLYCGAGLFAGALAPLVGPDGTVVGIESEEAAVRDARANLRDTPWARVHRGDVVEVLRRGPSLSSARLVVADPPRAGLARGVIEELSAGAAERFAYVSCDPATLARDLALLLARGWRLDGLRAFDAFPMTHHVECVAALVR